MLEKKCGFVAILGKPNVGKSTLLNRLVGKKISIVTHKAQTTRRQIQGVAQLDEHAQVVFVDTPGIFAAQKEMDKEMVRSAYKALSGVDFVILLMDGTHWDQKFLDSMLPKMNVPYQIVVNKIDACEDPGRYAQYCCISALKDENIDTLRKTIQAHLPFSPWFYPDLDQRTDLSDALWSAEITREQVLFLLHQEVPYAVYVITHAYQPQEDGSIKIDQDIVVSHERYKPMIIGKRGQMIKQIGTQARAILETELKKRVHLFLNVKVSEGWQQKTQRLRHLGVL